MTTAAAAPQRPLLGWTRTADARWQRVVIERGSGARATAAALAAFPGATVHGVVTDVLGGWEVDLETSDGQHLVVRSRRPGGPTEVRPAPRSAP